MRAESTTCNPELWNGAESSGFVTVECKPYAAKLSVRACAMRYARALEYDRGKARRHMVAGRLEDIHVNSLHCLKCDIGPASYDETPQAQKRGRRILDKSTGSKLAKAMRGGDGCTRKVGGVDYTVSELRRHIENQFKPGMSWANYGEWEIDHIIPKSAFNYKSEQDAQFKQCWALNNIQPLWVAENQKKQNKIATPL